MNELLNKVSSYNVFNYLLPGIVFAVLASGILQKPIGNRNIITAAFLYYFVGLVVSRFGSLVVEPLLRWLRLVDFSRYRNFVVAEKRDEKIGVLSEVNNTYRTFCAIFILLLLLRLVVRIEASFPFLRDWNTTILLSLLLILFLFSYRKQTAYITERIKANN
jgi:hypothetical protein